MSPTTRDGATWTSKTTIDFGARSYFDYGQVWKIADGEGAVTLTATCTHHPGANVPEGQKNEGSGTVVSKRSKKAGFVVSHVIEATFTGRGNFDIDTTYRETLERLPAEK